MMEIIVFGSGCPTCHKLKKLVDNIVESEALDATVTLSQDYAEMAKFNILSSPAIVIDGEVKVAGRVPSRDEILGWIKK